MGPAGRYPGRDRPGGQAEPCSTTRSPISKCWRGRRRTAGAGAARQARADARRSLHGLVLPLHLRHGRRALAVVRAADRRRCLGRRANHQADDRNLRALCRRRAGRAFSSSTPRQRARPSCAISASFPISSAAGSAPIMLQAAIDRAWIRGRSTGSGCTPRLTITQRRCASISGPGLSSMPAARCRSKTRASTASCRAPSRHRLLPPLD